jgi:hypothetical protein
LHRAGQCVRTTIDPQNTELSTQQFAGSASPSQVGPSYLAVASVVVRDVAVVTMAIGRVLVLLGSTHESHKTGHESDTATTLQNEDCSTAQPLGSATLLQVKASAEHEPQRTGHALLTSVNSLQCAAEKSWQSCGSASPLQVAKLPKQTPQSTGQAIMTVATWQSPKGIAEHPASWRRAQSAPSALPPTLAASTANATAVSCPTNHCGGARRGR